MDNTESKGLPSDVYDYFNQSWKESEEKRWKILTDTEEKCRSIQEDVALNQAIEQDTLTFEECNRLIATAKGKSTDEIPNDISTDIPQTVSIESDKNDTFTDIPQMTSIENDKGSGNMDNIEFKGPPSDVYDAINQNWEKQVEERWKILTDTQEKCRSIQEDVAMGQARTQKKSFDTWEEYIVGYNRELNEEDPMDSRLMATSKGKSTDEIPNDISTDIPQTASIESDKNDTFTDIPQMTSIENDKREQNGNNFLGLFIGTAESDDALPETNQPIIFNVSSEINQQENDITNFDDFYGKLDRDDVVEIESIDWDLRTSDMVVDAKTLTDLFEDFIASREDIGGEFGKALTENINISLDDLNTLENYITNNLVSVTGLINELKTNFAKIDELTILIDQKIEEINVKTVEKNNAQENVNYLQNNKRYITQIKYYNAKGYEVSYEVAGGTKSTQQSIDPSWQKEFNLAKQELERIQGEFDALQKELNNLYDELNVVKQAVVTCLKNIDSYDSINVPYNGN